MDRKYCSGCHDDVYNNGLGGSHECFLLKKAKIILRKEVHIDQVPPWNQRAKRFPDCYHKQRYVYKNING